MEAPIIGIERLRIKTDGPGITTLVGFYGCPLNCEYCLNYHCHSIPPLHSFFSEEKLLEIVSIDHLYYLCTGGGITFGGGEPLYNCSYIKSFKRICDKDWKINIETSLYAPLRNLKEIVKSVDNLIIDIKDINSLIYEKYTKRKNEVVLKNINWLKRNYDKKKVYFRVPQIPNFNNREDILRSSEYLSSLGFDNIEVIGYSIIKEETPFEQERYMMV